MGNTQCPQVIVEFHVPNTGSSAELTEQETQDTTAALTVRAYKVELEYNNHNEADTCTIECTIDDAGIDPRFLRSLECYVYIDDVGYGADLQPSIGNGDLKSGNLRFVGIAMTVERVMGEDKKAVIVKCHDYTCLFLQHKSGFSPRFLPSYSDMLTSAWNKICDGTGYITFDTSPPSIVSTVQALKNRILFEPESLADITLATAVSPGVAASGAKVEIPHAEGADAWAVWQHIVGSMGLITFIRGSQCVVTTATDFYSGDDPPRMIWGLNIAEIHEVRDQQSLSAKNIGIFSYNPMTHTHLESFYPPKGDITPKGRGKKKMGASALGPGISLRAQDYEVFQCPMAISDQKALDAFAERVWLERSRQELKGTLRTPLFAVWTNSQFEAVGTGLPVEAPSFSLLSLQAGDRIRVEVDQGEMSLIQALPSMSARIEALALRGYSETMAQYIADNLSSIQNVSPEFQVQDVRVTLDMSGDTGKFDVEVSYLNRVYVSGSAEPGAGTSIPAIAGQPL